MKVGVAYALPNKQVWLKIEVPEECTVKEAIEHSGLLKQFPKKDAISAFFFFVICFVLFQNVILVI